MARRSPQRVPPPSVQDQTDPSTPRFSTNAPPNASNDDLYGEDDYPPDEEAYDASGDRTDGKGQEASGVSKSKKVGKRTVSGETRVAPTSHDVEEEDEDEHIEPDLTRAGALVRLEVVAGPDEGRVRRFKGVRMVIGRTAGCDLKLKDQSVSRRHLELVQGEGGVLLRDLGSGNGTRVNGEPTSERILQHEDQIVIGKTKFRFVDEAYALRRAEELAKAALLPPPPPPQEEPAAPGLSEMAVAVPVVDPPPRPSAGSGRRKAWGALDGGQKKMVVLGLLGAVLLMALGAWWFIQRKGAAARSQQELMVSGRLEDIRVALDQGKADEALGLLEQLERLRPADPAVQVLKGEALVVKQLSSARALLESGKIEEARTELAAIPEGTPRENLRADLAAQLRQREMVASLETTSAAIARGDFELAERLMAGLSPEGREKLQPQLKEAQERQSQGRKETERRQEQEREDRKRREKAVRDTELKAEFSAVARRFHAGEYDRAVLECDRVIEQSGRSPDVVAKAEELKTLIPAFARTFEDGERKFKTNALPAAVKPLRRARDLYNQIGFTGALGARIDDDLATSAIAAAELEMANGDLPAGLTYYREAQKLGSTDVRVKEGIERIARRADQLVDEGLRLRESRPQEATAKLRQALELTVPGTPTYKKAKDSLASIKQ